MKKVAVSLSIGTLPLKPQVEEILKVLAASGVDGFVVLAGHSILDPIGSVDAAAINKDMPNKALLALANTGTWSAGYLLGMRVALTANADFVISMDADGSHDPQDLLQIINDLSKYEVVTASRFLPNAKNTYPLQRRVISWIGTLLTKLFLTAYKLTDFTSGYEGIRSGALRHILGKYPADKWVAVSHGPYHLQNTELRLALIDAGFDIHEIPIEYGKKRIGKTFDIKFLFQVFLGFIALVKNRKTMKHLLKTDVS